ncbi:MAG TPA: hypothetical protein VHD56_08355 [Tepidisphaeraceae bacterium]|nr:hypothetical protein [Tepidisphaeraceae bacterium]
MSQSPFNSPPSAEHLEQLAAARIRRVKIDRAVRSALFSAWTLAIFAAFSFVGGILSVSGMAIAIGLGFIAYFEFRGAAQMKRLDINGPKNLAINQIVLGALLFIYGAYSLWASLHAPPALSELSDADWQALGMKSTDLQDLERMIWIVLYITVMVVAIIAPGLTAWYYSTRAKFIKAYLSETPQWIVELQKAGMSV